MARTLTAAVAALVALATFGCTGSQKPAGDTNAPAGPAAGSGSGSSGTGAKGGPWELTYYGVRAIDAQTAFVYGLREGKPGSVVLKTTDGGQHWAAVLRIASEQETGLDLSDQDLVAMDFAGASDGAVLTDGGGLFVTADGGATWELAADPGRLAVLYDAQGAPNGASTSFASLAVRGERNALIAASREGSGKPGGDDATHPAILRTTDGGLTWADAAIQGAVPETTLTRVVYADDANGWAVGGEPDDEDPSGVVLQTTDGGATWKPVKVGSGQTPSDVFFLDAKRGWIVGQTEDEDTGDPGPSQVFATEDGGATWSPVAKLPISAHAVRFADASNGWIVGTSAKIYHTSDGGKTWGEQTAVDTAGGSFVTAPSASKADRASAPAFVDFALAGPGRGWALADTTVREFKQR